MKKAFDNLRNASTEAFLVICRELGIDKLAAWLQKYLN